jgi:Zn-dependent protease
MNRTFNFLGGNYSMEKSRGLVGLLILLLIKLSKPLLKIAGVFVKVLKGVGTTKVGLGAASFGVYSVMIDWRFAISVPLLIGIHESGHVWAMRKMGMATKGFYFIPFFGGAAVPESAFPSRWAEGYAALMGPLWGLAVTVVAYVLFLLTGNLVFEVAACWMAFINLLNLIPVYPLDGGRVVKSLTFQKAFLVLFCF